MIAAIIAFIAGTFLAIAGITMAVQTFKQKWFTDVYESVPMMALSWFLIGSGLALYITSITLSIGYV